MLVLGVIQIWIIRSPDLSVVLSRFMSFNNVCNRLRWSGSFMFYSIWNSQWSWKMETLVCTQIHFKGPTHKCAHIWREAKNILPHWLQFFAQLLRPFIRVLQCLKGAFVQFASNNLYWRKSKTKINRLIFEKLFIILMILNLAFIH